MGGLSRLTLIVAHSVRKGSRGNLETAFEKVLRRVLRRYLAVGFRGTKGFEKGS